jgi:hypothetical protein
MTAQSGIRLKPIHALLTDEKQQSTRFWIPAYQRGYRWKPLQVTQLLEDIREFAYRRNPQPEEFYCLQPLVLKSMDAGRYEVVDGQQRLTTLLLILRHFNERLAKKYQQTLFTLDYETRPDLLSFLVDPVAEVAQSNVDFFHLFETMNAIEQWFSNKDHEVEDIKSALLSKTKVIWFELSDKDNAVDAFTRLNVGKIPLTNDELIRALFLRRSDASEPQAAALQLKIAHEWDQLEKALQTDAFWYFLTNESGPRQNRIGLLFELVVKANGMSDESEHDAYSIFYAYSKRLKTAGVQLHDEWLKVKQTFMMLEEWYEDRTLYHIVGFLVHEGVALEEICAMSSRTTKTEFERQLKAQVLKLALESEVSLDVGREALAEQVGIYLDDMEYGRNSKKIRSILLLFNLATLLESSRSNLRFQFDSFKCGDWDIEHVRSVVSNMPGRDHERLQWLQLCLGHLETQDPAAELCLALKALIDRFDKSASEKEFEPMYMRTLKAFGEGNEEDVDDSISNLTLLDTRTNRAYKNAVFAVKRNRLLSLDQSGIFVPLCTRNVFLKCYSPQVDNVMFWSNDDRKAYLDVMVNTLVNFFRAPSKVSV